MIHRRGGDHGGGHGSARGAGDGSADAAPSGGGGQALTQLIALRVVRFDGVVSRFLDGHPRGMVVTLGEGLETQFWRVDDGEVR